MTSSAEAGANFNGKFGPTKDKRTYLIALNCGGQKKTVESWTRTILRIRSLVKPRGSNLPKKICVFLRLCQHMAPLSCYAIPFGFLSVDEFLLKDT